jgi:ankyrin repeat protein
MTPLHYAARYGFKELVNLLLATGCDVNIRDKNGFNASYWAEVNKHNEILTLLPPPKSIPPEVFCL